MEIAKWDDIEPDARHGRKSLVRQWRTSRAAPRPGALDALVSSSPRHVWAARPAGETAAPCLESRVTAGGCDLTASHTSALDMRAQARARQPSGIGGPRPVGPLILLAHGDALSGGARGEPRAADGNGLPTRARAVGAESPWLASRLHHLAHTPVLFCRPDSAQRRRLGEGPRHGSSLVRTPTRPLRRLPPVSVPISNTQDGFSRLPASSSRSSATTSRAGSARL